MQLFHIVSYCLLTIFGANAVICVKRTRQSNLINPPDNVLSDIQKVSAFRLKNSTSNVFVTTVRM